MLSLVSQKNAERLDYNYFSDTCNSFLSILLTNQLEKITIIMLIDVFFFLDYKRRGII